MLIKANDVANYTTEMNYCIVEASRMIDTFLMPYVTTLPYVVSGGGKNIPDQIVIAAADFSASIFKRRYVPSEVKMKNLMPDMINDVDGSGWFALGLKKLIEYIKDNFALTNNPASNNGLVFNPEIMKDLYMKGILTLKEARAYMANPNLAIQEVVTRLTTETLTRIETQTVTKQMYVTKKQNSVAFIAGANNDEQTNQGGYQSPVTNY
jgi:hypothetical protein